MGQRHNKREDKQGARPNKHRDKDRETERQRYRQRRKDERDKTKHYGQKYGQKTETKTKLRQRRGQDKKGKGQKKNIKTQSLTTQEPENTFRLLQNIPHISTFVGQDLSFSPTRDDKTRTRKARRSQDKARRHKIETRQGLHKRVDPKTRTQG